MLKSDIEDLHVSLNFEQFQFKLEHIEIKWAQNATFNHFKNYFFKEWIIHIRLGQDSAYGRFSKPQQELQKPTTRLNLFINKSRVCIQIMNCIPFINLC